MHEPWIDCGYPRHAANAEINVGYDNNRDDNEHTHKLVIDHLDNLECNMRVWQLRHLDGRVDDDEIPPRFPGTKSGIGWMEVESNAPNVLLYESDVLAIALLWALISFDSNA